MKTLAFFDLRLVGIKRYPLRLANAMAQMRDDLSFVFLYDQADGEREDEVRKLLPKNSILQRIEGASYGVLRKLLIKHNPEKLVVMAQRIPDSALVSTAKSLGIETAMYQHGLYIPFMRREKNLFLRYMRKTLRYARYAQAIAKARRASTLRYVWDYARVFVKGSSFSETRIDRDSVNVDQVFVYGEHWKAYHSEVYGYRQDQQVVVGYPDLDDVDEMRVYPSQEEPCYIAQTLVEDGRLDREHMVRFIDNMGTAVRKRGTKLVVKLHPRSDRSLYDSIADVAIFETGEFPNCKLYIGHYSSMIVKGVFCTDKIVLVNFPGHEIPSYLQQVSWVICSYLDDMTGIIERALNSEIDMVKVAENLKAQEYYFAFETGGAINKAAKAILASVDGG